MPARPSRGTSLVVSLVLLLAIVTPVGATDPTRLQPRTPADRHVTGEVSTAEFVPGELLVRFAPGMSASARRQAVEAGGGRLARTLRSPSVAVVEIPANADVRAAAAALSRRAGVAYAEPNYLYRFSATPDDPRFAEMWSLAAAGDRDIDAPQAWDVTTGSADVLVAVVDSGVDVTHPDLAGNIWTNPGEIGANGIDDDGNGFIDDVHGWDFVDEDNDPEDNIGHGTHVAGTIGAEGNNGQGMTGVAWDVSLLPIRAGDVDLTAADVLESFDYACDMGADVVNGSFGGPASFAVRDGITDCPGTLFVVAAGNAAKNVDNRPVYPCAYPDANIVCVAATDRTDALAFFSNFGSTAVDLAAPGDPILSATPRQVLFADGFEESLAAWVRESPGGRDWRRTTEAAASGVGSAADSPSSDYQNNSNTWIRTAAPIDLSVGSECLLDYAVEYDLSLFDDWLLVEGRDDGGAWRVIDSGADGELAWTGSSENLFVDWWEDLVADGFDGATEFDLRFRLVSDNVAPRDGVHVDDVVVHCLTGSHGTDDFVRFSGTSMAAPHVAGVAALLLSAYPDATVAELKAALLNGTDERSGLSGKVRSGGRLNARGALDELDEVRPVASAPSLEIVGGSRLGATTVPLRVSWAAATDADPSSGIDRYLVQRRSRIGSTWRAWKPVGNTPRLFLTVHTEPGTHQFRIQAIDQGGNRSAYRAGRRFTMADPQGGADLRFVRTWSTQSSPDFFDGSTRWTRVLRASAAHTFTGRHVAWVSTRASDRGRAKVYVDGVHVATVDLYRGTRRDRRVVFETSWDIPGTHSIKIKVISKGSQSSGPRVDFDAFITLS
jgi:subtilisin family serine protease